MVRFTNTPRVEPEIFTLPRFAGGSSLSEGRALPGEAPTLHWQDSRGGEGEACPRGTFGPDHFTQDGQHNLALFSYESRSLTHTRPRSVMLKFSGA